MDGSFSVRPPSAPQYVVAGRSRRRPGVRVDQRPGAHAGQERHGLTLLAQPGQVLLVGAEGAGVAAGVDQHRQVRHGLARVVGLDDEPLVAGHGLAVGREGRGGVAVLGEGPGPPREHLPRTDGVELLDAVEQQDAEVAGRLRRRGAAAWTWSCGPGSATTGGRAASGINANIRHDPATDLWHDRAMHRVVALALPEVVAFDLAIPAQIFGRCPAPAPYSFEVCAPEPGPVPTTTGYSVARDPRRSRRSPERRHRRRPGLRLERRAAGGGLRRPARCRSARRPADVGLHGRLRPRRGGAARRPGRGDPLGSRRRAGRDAIPTSTWTPTCCSSTPARC